MKLELDKIRTDGGTQPRGQIDWGVVSEYGLEMKDNGATFPAIVVFYDGRDYWLADGFHRYYATEQAGQQSIEADVRQGTQHDAQWYSYAANKSHGLRRSNEDKKRAVEAALRHPMAAGLSDRQIARHCGVSAMTIGRYRESICNNVTDTPRTVTRNGTTYKMSTAKIGKASEAATFASDTTLIVGYTTPRYCGLCGHMQSIRTDEIEQRIPQICSACGEQHLRWQYNAPAPGIGPVSHSEDGRVATVTVTNGDVAGGLAAVMEADAPDKPLDHWTKLEHGYAVYPCHVCEEKKIRIDPVGNSVRCEACGNTWDTIGDYHEERERWVTNDPIIRQAEPMDREQYLNGRLTCYRCKSQKFIATEGDGFSCFRCSTTWTSVASFERHEAAHDAPDESRRCLYCDHAQEIRALDLLEKNDIVCKKCKRVHNFWREPQPIVVEADGSLVSNSMAVHHSSKSVEHYTPPEIVDAVIEVMGAITLDPCSNSKTDPNVRAAIHYTVEDDGLSQAWFGNVYMNPPYGREIGEWVAKLTSEHSEGEVREAIALVPARPDTQWWKQLRDYPCCFVEGRLQFIGNDDPAPFPSAVFYLGTEIGRFYRVFSQFGDIWQRIEPGMFGE